jgi:hypothetical protein
MNTATAKIDGLITGTAMAISLRNHRGRRLTEGVSTNRLGFALVVSILSRLKRTSGGPL